MAKLEKLVCLGVKEVKKAYEYDVLNDGSKTIITMLKATPKIKTITAETARGGYYLNRGSVAECILRANLLGLENPVKQGEKAIDLNCFSPRLKNKFSSLGLNFIPYEIKLSTPHTSATRGNSAVKDTIVITPKGVYLLNKDTFDKVCVKDKINCNRVCAYGKRLNRLSSHLGFKVARV